MIANDVIECEAETRTQHGSKVSSHAVLLIRCRGRAAWTSGDPIARRLAFRRATCPRPAGCCRATATLWRSRRAKSWFLCTAHRCCNSACLGTLARNGSYRVRQSDCIQPKGRCRPGNLFRSHRYRCSQISPAWQSSRGPYSARIQSLPPELSMSRLPVGGGGGMARSLAPASAQQLFLPLALRPRWQEAKNLVWVVTLPRCCTARRLTR